ncbi:7TM-DISM domain-containing protein [Zwartia sp.]|uniref:sensor histidine kinase n=1 Tax=Zwartia sp. TaxID=2978004 RepID=UPI002727996F|nr:7TM-DISM domain-containing protein [Zwartia sp.]MDO9025259.1 7TM-DISM domain-containing protein [Zwartia sp.]
MTALSRCLFLLLFVAYCPAIFASGQHILSRSIYEDKTGQMTFEEVRDQKFLPADATYFKGYTRSAYWIKLRINPAPHEITHESKGLTDGLILRIQPSYLDDIRLYDPIERPPRVRTVGDHFPWIASEFPSLNYTFIIPAGHAQRDVWLRIQTTSTHMASIDAMSVDEFLDAERIQEISFGIWLGILIVMFLWSLGIWLIDRDSLVGFFAVNQLSVVMHALVIMGYFRIFLAPALSAKSIDLLGNIIILTFVFISILFFYRFNREFRIKKWVHWLFCSMLLLYPLNLGLLATGNMMRALNINVLGVTILAFSLITIPFFGVDWKQQYRPVISKRTMIFVNGIVLLVALVNSLPLLGITHNFHAAPFAGLTFGLVTGFIFLLVLQHRYRLLKEERISEVSRVEAIAQTEQSKRMEQEKFLTMLTHELKTPLSVLLLAHGSEDGLEKYKKHIGEAIKDMQNIIDRCVMADKFEHNSMTTHTNAFSLNDLIRNTIEKNFSPDQFEININEEYFIQSDEYLVNIVLTNLFDNALKYGDHKQKILVSVFSSMVNGRPHACIQVSNPPGTSGYPDPDRVFDKYYRAPLAYQKTGSGLGLFLVNKIMLTLNGQLVYKPSDDRVVFEVSLPVSTFASL